MVLPSWVAADVDLHVAARADRHERRLDVGDRAAALVVGGGADVDREADVARNHVGRARRRVDASDGADDVGLAAAARLDCQHAFRGGRQRILAPAHRHGARVSGHADDVDGEAVRAVDRRHDADRQAFRFEHRPLLDVQLGVGEHVGALPRGGADARGVEPERRERLAQRRSRARREGRARRGRASRRPRGCRGASSRNGRLPRRRIRRPRSRAAGASRARAARRRTRSPPRRRACRRTCRRRAPCRGASPASGTAIRASTPSYRPTTLPMASRRALMPASRIHASTRSFAARCSVRQEDAGQRAGGFAAAGERVAALANPRPGGLSVVRQERGTRIAVRGSSVQFSATSMMSRRTA